MNLLLILCTVAHLGSQAKGSREQKLLRQHNQTLSQKKKKKNQAQIRLQCTFIQRIFNHRTANIKKKYQHLTEMMNVNGSDGRKEKYQPFIEQSNLKFKSLLQPLIQYSLVETQLFS